MFFVIVTVHEWGHYFFAKRAGILVREFAIGFGPKLHRHPYPEPSSSASAMPASPLVTARSTPRRARSSWRRPMCRTSSRISGLGAWRRPTCMRPARFRPSGWKNRFGSPLATAAVRSGRNQFPIAQPLRISVSVRVGVIASGSSLISMIDGLPLARALRNASANSSVFSTVSPWPP